jgi:alpha-amylase
MTGAGGSGTGTGGSHWDGGALQYPGVPYGPNDFNGGGECHTGDGSIHNYGDVNEVTVTTHKIKRQKKMAGRQTKK